MTIQSRDTPATRYELGFGIFVVVLAFLFKDNPWVVYPQALYLLLALLALNLAAGVHLRSRRASLRLSGAVVLGNCAVIAAILAYTGGAASNLWVLFLLPVFTAALLLDARQAVGVTAAVVAINAVFALKGGRLDEGVLAFEALLKSGLFAFAALLAWRLASGERDSRSKLEAESTRADQLATRLEASSALSEVGLVGAGVAHDLSNSFMVITGFAETIEAQGLPPELRDGFERIRRVAHLGGQIARQLARHGAAARVERAMEDLDAVAGDTAKLVNATFLKKGVQLAIRRAGEPCPVLGSLVHLQRVFLNLLLNALSVSRPQGKVLLAVRREGEQVIAVVEDEGPGFPAEVLPRLFKPYETTRASAGGTGLGLNLCAKIAQQHDGRLAAENRPEGGARLTLRLPLASATKPA